MCSVKHHMVHYVDRIDFSQKSMSDHLNLGNHVKSYVENAYACNHRYEHDGFAIDAFSCYHWQFETDAAISYSNQMNLYCCVVELDWLVPNIAETDKYKNMHRSWFKYNIIMLNLVETY